MTGLTDDNSLSMSMSQIVQNVLAGEVARGGGSNNISNSEYEAKSFKSTGPSMSVGIGNSNAGLRSMQSRQAEGEDEDGGDITFDGIQDGGFHEGYWKARYGGGQR